MAKKRKFKKSFIILCMIVSFFLLYFVVFTLMAKTDLSDEEGQKIDSMNNNGQQANGQYPSGKHLARQDLKKEIKMSGKVYLSDGESDYIKIDTGMWEDFGFFIDEFIKVRKPDTRIKAVYKGHTDNGLKFETDLNYFKIYTVNRAEYFKIPVYGKKDLDSILKKLIYTSFDYVSNYKRWGGVTISDGKTNKDLVFWKKDDLASHMDYKRVVGKIQPEKQFERSKRNFTIKIESRGSNIEIVTMGKDYLKVTVAGETAYYEVSNRLYKYLNDDLMPPSTSRGGWFFF